MDEQLAKYLVGQVNVTRADCLISREQIDNKHDYVYVEGYKTGIQFYQGVQKRKAFKIKQNGDTEEINEPLVQEEKSSKPKPKKGTGGRFAYTKVYISRLEEIPREQLSFELIGVCLCLTSYIEWETGFLIIGRGKRRRYMTKVDLAKKLKVSLSSVKRFTKKLEDLGILETNEKGFRLNTKFLAKGRAFDAD